VISKLKSLYNDSRIAILGSGPSVSLYEEKEDIAIAVNGASFLNKKYNFFVAGDVRAPHRNWWLASGEHSNLITRVVSSYIAPFDSFLFPNKSQRTKLEEDYYKFVENNQYIHFVPDLSPVPPHLYFKFGGFGIDFVDKISSDQISLYWGGTISAIALQIALIMGGKDIHIYGCGFNNTSGVNYHYNCSIKQRGWIEKEQLQIMQLTIEKIRSFGIKIKVHGKSNIK
jgi:hypothetical protein